MKRFLLKLLAFAIVYVVVTGAMVVALVAIERSVVHFRVPPGTRIVILGDSRPECAVNDRLIPGVWNFAHSGLHAFYSFVKLRELARENPDIEWFVVGYSLNDVPAERDDWVTATAKVRQYLPTYLFLMTPEEIQEFWHRSPRGFLLALGRVPPTVLRDVLRVVLRGSLRSWGGYQALDRQKLRVDLERLRRGEFSREGTARLQVKFLRRMVDEARDHSVRVALFQPPIHRALREFYEPIVGRYRAIADGDLEGTPLLDHAAVEIPEDGFGDLLHLNRDGARVYSQFLRERGFATLGCRGSEEAPGEAR